MTKNPLFYSYCSISWFFLFIFFFLFFFFKENKGDAFLFIYGLWSSTKKTRQKLGHESLNHDFCFPLNVRWGIEAD